MSFELKWGVEECSSTLHACGFELDEKEMMSHNPISEKNNSNERKGKTKIDDTEQPSIADKEYIVFLFNEDGGIDLVEENSPLRNQDDPKDGMHHNHKASKKLVFDGSSEGLQFIVSEDGVMILDNEGEERNVESSKKLFSSDVKGHGDDIKVRTETEESTEHKPVSESTRSDSSAGSFAFPVMNLEMTGSPERMPKYTEQKKIERILRFPCCKF